MCCCETRAERWHGHGWGRGSGECGHGECCCGPRGWGFRRRFMSAGEERELLEEYRKELGRELEGLEERLKDLGE